MMRQYHDEASANTATEFFYRQVHSRYLAGKDYVETTLAALDLPAENLPLITLCAALEPTKSKTQVRELVVSGAVTVNGDKVEDIKYVFGAITDALEIKIGKRGYHRVAP